MVERGPVYQQMRTLIYKTTPIADDYIISEKVLGQGINGSVVQVQDKKTCMVFALKVVWSCLLPYLRSN